MAHPSRHSHAGGQRVALEVVALVGAAESGVSYGRYCRHCAALWTGSRPWRPQVLHHAVPVSGDSVVELLDPCPLRRVRQTHESVRRLPYWCSDRSFRGVLGSGVRLRVDVRDSRECRRAARFVTSDILTDGLTPRTRSGYYWAHQDSLMRSQNG